MPAPDAPHLELQEYAQTAGRKIPNATKLAIIPSGMFSPAGAAAGFFERRTSVTIRACGSPNTPRTCSIGRKPANRYASSKRRRFAAVTKIRPPTPPLPRLRNHLRFATEIRASTKSKIPLSTSPSLRILHEIHPHDFTKTPFYLVETDRIVIVRVLDGRRDIEREFSK